MIPQRSSRQLLMVADGMAVLVIFVTIGLTVEAVWSRPQPHVARRLAPGIQYECAEVRGALAHLVTIDLRSPDNTVEVGPMVPTNEEFRLVWLPTLMRQQAWDVAVSGGDFETTWGRYSPAGSLGRPMGAVIESGRTLQRQRNGVILWFDEFQTGHMEAATADSEAWVAARWCLGGRELLVDRGEVVKSDLSADAQLQRRTVVGLDRTGCTLFLAAFEAATLHQAADDLVARGVWQAMEFGTDDNAGVVLSNELAGMNGGIKVGPHRFITHALGVRTRKTEGPLRDRKVMRSAERASS